VRADAGQLDQVLLNLAINARDAMPRGGTITISARNVVLPHEAVRADTDSSDFVALSVRDQGTGIPPELIEKIFDPFFTTKPPGQGTGLGLATCNAIAAKAGGWIACASEPGKGTQFTIYLPAVDEQATRVASPRYDGELPRGGETVLIVEDEPAVGELLALLLDNLGYNVVRAEDGEQAEAAVAEHDGEIDLVLTDLNMPRMDGRELMTRLCARNSNVKVILTSGNDITELGDASDVAFDFLPKPFTMESLAQKVRAVLDVETAGV
jgi:two-component system cell cycle sensor histidine kinase/response regulator CckA